ncbi:Protein of uncharacterised function (DUF3800) [Bordetella ansorpii]|uniref:Protein of uncharacterized function (DUF3800) n=1 Tax=Bordetella ansorpii TaxID=288768 RepID=A0A157KMT2_9BORD|nr:DUF3800 domain-containing protein [Bordetella ansorpii]SAH85848.1 Protein of uncharacterised function (DUF3800) [Bordetella ansorpii]
MISLPHTRLAEPSRQASEKRFSDFIVYVDESGDHSLASIDKSYPIFVLALCVFQKRHYAETVVPEIETLKFHYFGHDNVVLHEHEIRKQKRAFSFLSHRPAQDEFTQALTALMERIDFVLIAGVVDKQRVGQAGELASNPYHLALGLCPEALRGYLAEKGQGPVKTHILVECRGKKRRHGTRTRISPHLQ